MEIYYQNKQPKETILGAEEALCLKNIERLNYEILQLDIERKNWNKQLKEINANKRKRKSK